jgi:hypothetical protein
MVAQSRKTFGKNKENSNLISFWLARAYYYYGSIITKIFALYNEKPIFTATCRRQW